MDTSKDTTRPTKRKPALTKKRKPAKKAAPAKRPGPGRPPFEPTEEQREFVAECAEEGASHDEICILFEKQFGESISDVTLRKHFDGDIKAGRAMLCVMTRKSMRVSAREGNFAAQKWILAVYAGQFEPTAPPPEPPPPPPPVRVIITTAERPNVEVDEGDDDDELDKLLVANTTTADKAKAAT